MFLFINFVLLLIDLTMQSGIFKHFNCRNTIYPNSKIARFKVPDEFVFWTTPFANYNPPIYTAPHINGQVWADPEIPDISFKPLWNALDKNVNRVSYIQNYEIKMGYPMNPIGRTGLRGRGRLGRWGPNHAADPIVTRWKRDQIDSNIIKNAISNKPILQLIVIQRHDNKKWAIPGGMVDPGEMVNATLKREFMEEALNNSDKLQILDDFFSSGVEIFKGYVDDYRNTDNAWIETVAYSFHDETGKNVGQFQLMAGDDAANVKWLDMDSSVDLHASHGLIIKEVAEKLKAHW